jgi:hypothetical protein
MRYREEEKPDTFEVEPITDYSEEAIAERDPAYRLPAATLCDVETVEYLPLEERRVLARRLEELGMSPGRVAFVASL